MKLIFQDAVSTRNAFDEFIKIEDDPDVGLVIRNEILDEIDGISKMVLTVEDTSEKLVKSLSNDLADLVVGQKFSRKVSP